MPTIDYDSKIPNNVDLKADKRLQRALEHWQPGYIEWWRSMGPTDFNEKDVFLRTAIDVGADGWANYGFVKMPEYRWGIFVVPSKIFFKIKIKKSFGSISRSWWKRKSKRIRQIFKDRIHNS
jgi:benzoyl-CoA 2,3-dioxygenase component B